jgi:hypothetical protein
MMTCVALREWEALAPRVRALSAVCSCLRFAFGHGLFAVACALVRPSKTSDVGESVFIASRDVSPVTGGVFWV